MQAETVGGNSSLFNVTVIFGCFGEKSFSAKVSSIEPWLIALSDSSFKIILPSYDSLDSTAFEVLTYDLRDSIVYTADQPNCFASQVKMC